MSEAAKLFVSVSGDVSGLASEMAAGADAVQRFGREVQTTGDLAKGVAFGSLIADGVQRLGEAVVGYAQDTFNAIMEVDKLNAQTAAAITSTGGAAGVSADHVAGLADSLERVSGVEAEVVQAGENMLLTFTNVRNGVGAGNDIFDQATKTALDMSVAMGTDAKGAAMQLGKALNDPIAGVGALSRVGVTFTEGQKATIKALVDSGKTMEAQKMILSELNKEFGGSAEAAGNTLPGALKRLENGLGNIGETIMGGALPAVQNFALLGAGALESFGKALQDNGPEIQAIKVGLVGIAAVATAQVAPAIIRSVIPALAGMATAGWAALSPMAPLYGGAIALGLAAYGIMKNWEPIKGFFVDTWNTLSKGVSGFYENFRGVFSNVGAIVSKVAQFIVDKIGPVFNLLPDNVKAAFGKVGDAVLSLPKMAAPALQAVGKTVGGAAKYLGGMATGVVDFFTKVPGHVQAGTRGVVAGTEAAAKGMSEAAKAAKQATEEIGKAFASLPGKLQAIDVKAKLFGEQAEVNARQASALRNAIEDLIDKGLSPTDKRIQALVAQWKKHNEAAEKARVKVFDVQGAMEDVAKELKLTDNRAAILGETFDKSAEQTRIYEAALRKLADNGVSPTAKEVRDLQGKLAALKPPVEPFRAFQGSVTDVMTAAAGLKDGVTTLANVLNVDLSSGLFRVGYDAGQVGVALVQIGTGIGPVIQKITDFLPHLVGLAGTISTSVVPTLFAMGGAVVAALGPFGLLAVGIGAVTWAAIAVTGSWEDVLAVARLFIPAIGPIADAFFYLRDNWEDVVTSFRGGVTAIKRFLFDWANAMKTTLNGVIDAVNWFVDGFNRLAGVVGITLPRVGRLTVQTWEQAEAAKAAAAAIRQQKEDLDALTKSIGEGLTSGTRNAFQGAIKAFLEDGKSLTNGLREGIKGAIISGITEAALQGAIVKGSLGKLMTELTDTLAGGGDASGVIGRIGAAIPGIASNLERQLAPLRDVLASALPTPKEAVSGATTPTGTLASSSASLASLTPAPAFAPAAPGGNVYEFHYHGTGGGSFTNEMGEQFVGWLRQKGVKL